MTLNKKQVIIVISSAVLVLVLIVCCWFFRNNNSFFGQNNNFKSGVISGENILDLTGKVEEINLEGNYLTITPNRESFQVKVFILDTTKMVKTVIPIGKKSKTSTVQISDIGIADFKVGDMIFVESGENIAGKKEIKNTVSIQILQ